MLQLATIVSMVKPWKTRSTLRVFLCIDALNDNAYLIQSHLEELLNQLRINAQTRMVSWENVTSLLNNPLNANQDVATISIDGQQSTTSTASPMDEYVDVNDEYIRGINELIRQQCENTSCLYLYLPRPPRDKALFSRYMDVLNTISNNLPPVMFVHGVSSVTCTRL